MARCPVCSEFFWDIDVMYHMSECRPETEKVESREPIQVRTRVRRV